MDTALFDRIKKAVRSRKLPGFDKEVWIRLSRPEAISELAQAMEDGPEDPMNQIGVYAHLRLMNIQILRHNDPDLAGCEVIKGDGFDILVRPGIKVRPRSSPDRRPCP